MPVRRWTAEEERDALILEDNAFFEKYPDRTPEGRRFKRARLARMGEGESSESGIIYHDKVEPTFHWRDAIGYAKSGQALAASMHEGQDTALIELNAEEENPFILFLSDTHIGDWSTDYGYPPTRSGRSHRRSALHPRTTGQDSRQLACRHRTQSRLRDVGQPWRRAGGTGKWHIRNQAPTG
jgi:hypothetical protein